jgi:hypothetical protein
LDVNLVFPVSTVWIPDVLGSIGESRVSNGQKRH